MLISSTTLSVLLLIGEKHAVLQMKFSFLPSRFLLFTFFFLITFLGRELYLTFKAEAFSLRSRFISLLNRERINCPFMLNADSDGEILLKFYVDYTLPKVLLFATSCRVDLNISVNNKNF